MAHVEDNTQIRNEQHSGAQLLNDSMAKFPDNNEFTSADIHPFDPKPSSNLETFKNSNSNSNVAAVSDGISNWQDRTEVCYGTVYRTSVLLVGDMLQLDRKLQQTEAPYGFGFASFEIRRGREEITLHLTDGSHFASTSTPFFMPFKAYSQRIPFAWRQL
jgi:hypothetical protein